jgi:RNA polymerase sigma-70 factor (ECF subfamily)
MIQAPADDVQRIASALSRYEGPLLRYASRLLGDADRARDVVQDTFLRLCREDPARLDGRLAPWLFTVCRNRVIDVQRQDGRVETLDERALEEHPSGAPGPARVLEAREDLDAVLRTLGTLPASQQEVVRLRFQAGLSYQEIASVTGLTANHVGVLLHNALKTLRERIR